MKLDAQLSGVDGNASVAKVRVVVAFEDDLVFAVREQGLVGWCSQRRFALLG